MRDRRDASGPSASVVSSKGGGAEWCILRILLGCQRGQGGKSSRASERSYPLRPRSWVGAFPPETGEYSQDGKNLATFETDSSCAREVLSRRCQG